MRLQEDLNVFTDDFGVSATVGATTGLVIFDQPDTAIFNGDVISTDYSMTFKSSLFPGLANNNTVTIESVSYRVRGEPKKLDDGAFTQAFLSKV